MLMVGQKIQRGNLQVSIDLGGAGAFPPLVLASMDFIRYLKLSYLTSCPSLYSSAPACKFPSSKKPLLTLQIQRGPE